MLTLADLLGNLTYACLELEIRCNFVYDQLQIAYRNPRLSAETYDGCHRPAGFEASDTQTPIKWSSRLKNMDVFSQNKYVISIQKKKNAVIKHT